MKYGQEVPDHAHESWSVPIFFTNKIPRVSDPVCTRKRQAPPLFIHSKNLMISAGLAGDASI
jgi:hypothetical protein